MMHRAVLKILLAARIRTTSRRRAQVAGGHDFIDSGFHYGFLCLVVLMDGLKKLIGEI
ncbi:MAG: hypothetical protein IKO65_08860 [Victivallales bacterium]|nr:hypothetical protein [Victivallales bacterium]